MKKESSKPTPARTAGEPKAPAVPRGGRRQAGKGSANADPVAEQAQGTQALVAAMPHSTHKARDFGRDQALAPARGATAETTAVAVSASTVSESNVSAKTGQPVPPGARALDGSVAQARIDGSGQVLNTNQGVAIADNQNSLKAGLRGPTLLEDFILREKITHFDHERIPERIVHARGSAAHGFFEAYEALPDLTCAAPFAEAGKV
ncbi:MAG: catalase, partial [Rubrivivax sp.]|nr:catalase [Rubrivivax sp.]